uniref:Uncharacterized protein n=1 Tax=Knipowitschia caucasica TaxID=637954 RepID=A0AAV2MQF9_KNICA
MSPLRRPVGHKLSVGLPESQQDSTPTSIDFHDQQWERRTGLLHHQALDLELFGSVVNLVLFIESNKELRFHVGALVTPGGGV